MLTFVTAILPWTYIKDSMTEEYPVGSFYLAADEMLPRSVKPTEFWVITDRNDPIKFYINGGDAGTLIPRSRFQRVYLRLYEPPATNSIKVTNGIDPPVYMNAAITHMVKEIEVFAREIYAYAGRTNEKYSNLITSPWSAFLIDYQLPFRKYLPDVRALRILSTKLAAKILIGESGLQGGIRDISTVFTSTSPVIVPCRNPEDGEMDLYQPVTGSDEFSGSDFHIWIPNLCILQWLVFHKLMNNVDEYTIAKMTEETVTVSPTGTDEYVQHLVNYPGTSQFCSIRDLLLFYGCMDGITAAGLMHVISDIPICAFANPFDQMVEHPGIGAFKFLDSGSTFDTEPVPYPPDWPFDSIYDIDLLTDYWVGTSLSKRFDFGGCLDSFPTPGIPPWDTACCPDSADAVQLETLLCSESVTSTTTPHHPLFGGDDPGLLHNPYFGLLV